MKQFIARELLHKSKTFQFSPFHPPVTNKHGQKSGLGGAYCEINLQEFDLGDDSAFESRWNDENLSVNDILTSIDQPNRGEKVLLVGERGCGMSTALLKSAIDQSEYSDFEFVLFLNPRSFSWQMEKDRLLISFGKLKTCLYEFCSIYGKHTLILLDNSECLPNGLIKNILNHENMRDTTILCGFQSPLVSDSATTSIPVKHFSRCYTCIGFSSSELKKLARKMLGKFWNENLYQKLMKELPHDNDVMTLSLITSLMHLNCNLQEVGNADEYREKYINFKIIDMLKNEKVRKQQPVTTKEISQQFKSLQETIVEYYLRMKDYSDQHLMQQLSLSLRVFIIKRYLISLDSGMRETEIFYLKENHSFLAREIEHHLKTWEIDEHNVMIKSNCKLKHFMTEDVDISNRQLSIHIREIFFNASEILSWKVRSSIQKMRVCVTNLDVDRLLKILSKFKHLHNLELSCETLSQDNLFSFVFEKLPTHAPNLKKVTLIDIPQIVRPDMVETCHKYSSIFKSITLHRVNIEFGSPEKMVSFCDYISNIGKTTEEFVLELNQCTLGVRGIERNASFLFICQLSVESSQSELLDLVDSQQLSVFSEYKHESVDLLQLSFENGTLNKFSLGLNIVANTCESLANFFTKISFKGSRTYDFENLNSSCKNPTCKNCSPLLSVLSIGNSTSSDNHWKNAAKKVMFGLKQFEGSNIEFLADVLTKNCQKALDEQLIIEMTTPGFCLPREAVEKLGKLKIEVQSSEDVVDESSSITQENPISPVYDVIEVEVDHSGWGFTRFTLTPEPVTLRFSNGVSVEWSRDSTFEDRMVCVEVHCMPERVVKSVCESKQESVCMLSPFLFIDQIDDKPFLKPATVTMPYSIQNNHDFSWKTDRKTKVFAYNDGDVKKWQAVNDSSKYELLDGVFKYSSTTFSPVGAVTNGEESTLNPTDFWEIYLPESVYLIVCPSQYDTKIIFDCRKFRNEEEHKKLKLTIGARFRKLNEMSEGDLIFGSIAGNLLIDEHYGYSLRDDKKLVFYYPNPEHESNKQEYKMKIISKSRDPEGTITYYKEFLREEAQKMQKLFHLKLELQVVPITTERPGYKRKNSFIEAASPKKQANAKSAIAFFDSEVVLTHDTLKQVLRTCKMSWLKLLEDLQLEKNKINKLQDQNLGEVLTIVKEKVTEEQGKQVLRQLFQLSAMSALDYEQKISTFYSKHKEDLTEAFWQCSLHWLTTTDSNYRNVSTLLEAAELAGVPNSDTEDWQTIKEGTCVNASRELVRTIDKRGDEQNVIKQVASFLRALGDAESKDMAINLLMRKM